MVAECEKRAVKGEADSMREAVRPCGLRVTPSLRVGLCQEWHCTTGQLDGAESSIEHDESEGVEKGI